MLSRDTIEDTFFEARAPEFRNKDFLLFDVLEAPEGDYLCVLGLPEDFNLNDRGAPPGLSTFVIRRTFDELMERKWDSDALVRVTQAVDRASNVERRSILPISITTSGFMTFIEEIYSLKTRQVSEQFGFCHINATDSRYYFESAYEPKILSERGKLVVQRRDDRFPQFLLGTASRDKPHVAIDPAYWPDSRNAPANLYGVSDSGHLVLFEKGKSPRVCVWEPTFGEYHELENPVEYIDVSDLGLVIGQRAVTDPERLRHLEDISLKDDQVPCEPCYWNEKGVAGTFAIENEDDILDLSAVVGLRDSDGFFGDHAMVGAIKGADRSEAVIYVGSKYELDSASELEPYSLEQSVQNCIGAYVDASRVTPSGVIVVDEVQGESVRRVALIPIPA